MSKVFVVGLFTLGLVGSADAQAVIPCPSQTLVYCPVGTCGKSGSSGMFFESLQRKKLPQRQIAFSLTNKLLIFRLAGYNLFNAAIPELMGGKIMKAVAIGAMMALLCFALTGPVQAGRWGDFTYCKSGVKVANAKVCKENGGKR